MPESVTAETGPVAAAEAVLAQAIHDAECEAYTHEGRNARCERSARAGVAALAAAGLLADPPATNTHEFTEDINDGSMCVCGIPAIYHDQVMARAVRDTTDQEQP